MVCDAVLVLQAGVGTSLDDTGSPPDSSTPAGLKVTATGAGVGSVEVDPCSYRGSVPNGSSALSSEAFPRFVITLK